MKVHDEYGHNDMNDIKMIDVVILMVYQRNNKQCRKKAARNSKQIYIAYKAYGYRRKSIR